MSNITDIISQIDTSNNDTNYQLTAVIVMNILLLLERIFKNGKFFIRCTKSGLFCGTRSPPSSSNSSDLHHDTENITEKSRSKKESTELSSSYQPTSKNTRSKSRSIDLE